MLRRRSQFKRGAGHIMSGNLSAQWWPAEGGEVPPNWWPTTSNWWPTGSPWWPPLAPATWGHVTDPRALYHPNLLIMRFRPSAHQAPAFAALNQAAPRQSIGDTGLDVLELLQQSGRIKRVRPLSREVGQQSRDMAAAMAGPHRPLHTLQLTAAHAASAGTDKDALPGTSVIELDHDVDVVELRDRLAEDGHLEFVNLVPVRYLAGKVRPKAGPLRNPPSDPGLWNLQKIQWAQARALAGFNDAAEVKVGVLDTGVDEDHPDLRGRIAGYVFQHPDIPNASGRNDIVGHGTHVSGTIGATNNNHIGINGICAAKIFVWKIFTDEAQFDSGGGSFGYFVDPVMYHRALADALKQKMQVINLSIGGPGRPDASESQLFASLIRAGVAVVAAMGNDREIGSPISFPAAIPGVIAVGATGIDDTVASFSNRGNHISLCAPGVGIWSTLPTYAGQEGFYAVPGPGGQPMEGKPIKRETDYDAWDGTSMATPHVTGAAALRLAKTSGLTLAQLKSALENSADKVADMNNQAFTPDYGFGRLNLLKLLR